MQEIAFDKLVPMRRPVTLKVIRVMKIAAILLTLSLYASAGGHSQGITLSLKNVSLEKVFTEIEKQTTYHFAYRWELLQKAKPVDMQVNKASIKDVLELCFKDQELLSYQILDNTIIIKEKVVAAVSNTGELPRQDIKGKVVDEKGEPISGATISVKGNKQLPVTSNDKGDFFFSGLLLGDVLLISHVSYFTKEIKLDGKTEITVELTLNVKDLEPAVATGYQVIKENKPGFASTMNQSQIERTVSTDILSRIDGMVPKVLIYGKNANPLNNLIVNGKSTITANAQPLIVVDNFQYSGDITAINPNDIESITVLTDPASAAVWGAYSGNGVIVITTKKGSYNQGVKLNFNSRITITEKPDIFYDQNFLNSFETINVETYLFQKGYYDADLANTVINPPVSQAVEILAKRRTGLISASDSATMLDALRSVDVRNDISKYFYRKAINQEYSLSVSGGSNKTSYYLSGGYNKDLSGVVNTKRDRMSFTYGTKFKPLEKLEITGGLDFVETKNHDNGSPSAESGGKVGTSPYTQLADEAGSPLPIIHLYRYSFIESPPVSGLLDWRYIPLNELKANDFTTKSTINRISAGIRYEIIKGLTAEIKYQYMKQSIQDENYYHPESFHMRDIINKFSAISNNTVVERNIPLGGLLVTNNNYTTSHNGRGQVNYTTKFGKHSLSAFAAIDVSETRTDGNASTAYGYDDATGISYNYLNYDSTYRLYPSGSGSIAIAAPVLPYRLSRRRSFAANASYTYNNKYTFYISGRLDQANIFGVKTNQKGTPLWSTYFSWAVNKEKFYKVRWLPRLQFKISYGYNGNYGNNSALTAGLVAASGGGINPTPVVVLNSPGNPYLRWEKIGVITTGFDFEIGNKLLWGSIEYGHKNGVDMLGLANIASSTGFTYVAGNNSNMSGNTTSIVLNRGMTFSKIKWNARFLLSYATDKITKISPNSGLVIGKPQSGLFAYRWGGLDNQGDPQGYLGDTLSKDYNTIIQRGYSNPETKVYKGSKIPTIYGSLNNTISIGNLSFSFLIKYYLKYYFNRNSVFYSSLFTSGNRHNDYIKRWQKKGDEAYTNVPALVYSDYPQFSQRDVFYKGSEALVEKGDHIRLQDINISYSFSKKQWKKLPFSYLSLYFYANNLGIIWKANKQGLDPIDPSGFRAPKSYSFGIRAEL